MNSLTGLFGNSASKKNNANKNKKNNVTNVGMVENAVVANVGLNTKNNGHMNAINVAVENVSVKNETKNKNNVVAQEGGVAPAFYQTPLNMRQPSEEVMNWATTSGVATPSANQMRNVAHGGARKQTRKHKKAKSQKKQKNHKKVKSQKKQKKSHKQKKSLKRK